MNTSVLDGMPEHTSSELVNDIPGFGMHFAKHFSEVFWVTDMRYMIEDTSNNAYGNELLCRGKIYFRANGVHNGLLLRGHVYAGLFSISRTWGKSKGIPGLLLDDDLKKSDMGSDIQLSPQC